MMKDKERIKQMIKSIYEDDYLINLLRLNNKIYAVKLGKQIKNNQK